MPNKRSAAAVHASLNVTFGSSRRQQVDVFVPAGGSEQPLIACVHGGWWQSSARESTRALALHLAEMGYPSACIGHRLFDEVPDGRPMRKDLVEALAKAVEECGLLGCPARHSILLAQGSGALSALACLEPLMLDGCLLLGAAVVAGAPGLAPWPECPERQAKQLRRYAGAAQEELDPLRYCGESAPIVLIHGEDDELIPIAAVRQWHDQLAAAGAQVRLELLRHARQDVLLDPCSGDGEQVLQIVQEWLQQVLGGEAGEAPLGEPRPLQKLEQRVQHEDELG